MSAISSSNCFRDLVFVIGMLVFGTAWLAAAILCLVFGKRWNKEGIVHRFCGMAVQKWAIVFGIIGLFLLKIGIQLLIPVLRGHAKLD